MLQDVCSSQGLVKLGVDAVSFDYPSGPSKGYCNRVLYLGRFASWLWYSRKNLFFLRTETIV